MRKHYNVVVNIVGIYSSNISPSNHRQEAHLVLKGALDMAKRQIIVFNDPNPAIRFNFEEVAKC